MSEEVDEQATPPVTDGVTNVALDEESLFDNLVQRREEIASERETMIPVPGFEDPQLLIKYGLVAGDDLNKIGRKNQKVKDRYQQGLFNAVDVMIRACQGIYIVLDGDEPVQLTADGDPVDGFTPAFASKMKLEGAESARGVVFALFNHNDIAIGQHSFKLQRWMGDTSLNIDEDLMLAGM